MKKRSRFWTLSAFAALWIGSAGAHGEDRSAWRESSVWDDGQAEFCVYEVSWRRYGRSYAGRALLIAVKEPWAPDLEVKADSPRADGFEVIKLNHIRDVPTGIYTYHQMASVFVRRDSGKLQKIAATSSEGCGISTAQMVEGRLSSRSYFDGQGERAMPYPAGALPEDGLPALLRDLVSGELPPSLSVFPTLMTGRFAPLKPAEFALSRRHGVVVEAPAGEISTTALELEGEGGAVYYFGEQPPYPLIRLERDDGTTYALAKCERIPYWELAAPGGEQWLPESLR